jgi:hypothetical protein
MGECLGILQRAESQVAPMKLVAFPMFVHKTHHGKMPVATIENGVDPFLFDVNAQMNRSSQRISLLVAHVVHAVMQSIDLSWPSGKGEVSNEVFIWSFDRSHSRWS